MKRIAQVLAGLVLCAGSSGCVCTDREAPALALPGAEPLPARLAESLRAAVSARGDDYQPRTRHREEDGRPIYTNRLILEASPYLQQHAHNPVNWYPWGEEAFAVAAALDRPIFLSIGYSTCHWCHVMEDESFDDESIARYLNEHYVAIKVDREERPDVDAVYMRAVQAMGQRGGWPLNVWLTPDREPFFGGTYFPPHDQPGRIGFDTILKNIRQAYEERRGEVSRTSAKVAERVRSLSAPPEAGTAVPGDASLHAAAAHYLRHFDATSGGLRPGPDGNKFPSSLNLRFLLRYHRRSGDPRYLEMATLTLDRMAAGGIYDHIGGGFHRYSTDPRWLVPHFEKMLYDNALLSIAYLEAAQATGEERYRNIAADILGYVDREMTSPGGGFYAATDADSPTAAGDREEGRFFTWTPTEIRAALSSEAAAALVIDHFGVRPEGHQGGRTVLHVRRPLAEVARSHELSVEAAETLLEAARRELYRARQRRPAPHRDDKILTAWNGLMISAFARASRALSAAQLDCAGIATRAARFVLSSLRSEGRLLRRYVDGRAGIGGYLADYAFFVAGLLDLFEATGEGEWLEEAIALTAVVEDHFAARGGGYHRSADDGETILVRDRPMADGAEPSGNSVHALNLLRLYQLTGDAAYRERADALLRSAAPVLARDPIAMSELLLAIDFRSDTPKEIAVVTGGKVRAPELEAAVGRSFVPNAVTVVASTARVEALAVLVPWLGGKAALRGSPTAYVCEDRRCELPTSDPEVLRMQLGKVVPLDAAADAP